MSTGIIIDRGAAGKFSAGIRIDCGAADKLSAVIIIDCEVADKLSAGITVHRIDCEAASAENCQLGVELIVEQ